MLFHVVDPAAEVVKTFPVCHIIDQNDAVRVSQITGNQTFEPLLACSVPKLQSDGLLTHSHVLGDEIDSNGGLDSRYSTL